MQLALADIKIPPNRQRSEIDPSKIADLSASIRAIGLLHPLVVRQEAGDWFLVAGETRLNAIKMLQAFDVQVKHGSQLLPKGMVPVNNLGELSHIERMEAELEENIRRTDLSMQDRVQAISRLHELRKAQAASTGGTHSVAATGAEAFPDLVPDVQRNKAWQALTIARSMETMPELAKVKTEAEAMKIIKRASTAEQNRRLADLIGEVSVTELHEVYHADCTDWLAAYSGPKFDCILIDPPYGMDAESFGDSAGRMVGLNHNYIDTANSFRALMGTVAPLLSRCIGDEAHLYVWCDISGFLFLRELFRSEGWWVFRTPLVNVKRDGGRVPWPEHGPRRCYELCLYAVRGKKPVTAIYRDVFESTLETTNIGHGAQKPVEAYVDLLKRSCRPGDRVLDCFAGSGTILDAAHSLKLRAVAVEKEAGNYGLCLKRLEGLEGLK